MARHHIRYANSFEYASFWAEWPGRLAWTEKIARAYDAAKRDAARYGDEMHELVSVDGRHVTTRENLSARAIHR